MFLLFLHIFFVNLLYTWHMTQLTRYHLYVLTSPAENDLKVALNMVASSTCKKRHAGAYILPAIDSNGIWNVIRNVFSIFFTFVWCEVCVNKVYFWQKQKIWNLVNAMQLKHKRALLTLRDLELVLLLQFNATSELVEKAKELGWKCMQRKPEKWNSVFEEPEYWLKC